MTTFRSNIEQNIPGARAIFQGIDAIDRTIRRTVHKDLGALGAGIILGGLALVTTGLKARTIGVVTGLAVAAIAVHDLAVKNGLITPSRVPETKNSLVNKGVRVANEALDGLSDEIGTFLSDDPANRGRNKGYTILPDAITRWFR